MNPHYHEVLELRQRYPNPTDLFKLGQDLRRSRSSETAIWLLQQLELYWDALRLEAFRNPEVLLYEPQALQMASRWPLAQRRAAKAAALFPKGTWLEVGAGIGGDTLELARVSRVRAVESDPQRFELLQHNIQVSGLAEQVELHCGDGLEHAQGVSALYADPARRNSHQRERQQLQPPPPSLWALELPTCLKLAPGVDESTLPAGVEIDYVSHQGVCKEAVVWSRVDGSETRAFRYAGDLQWLQAERRSPPPVAELEPGMWVHEPDPAAIRAQCWLPESGWRFDPDLALLATPPGVRSSWCSSFELVSIENSDIGSLKKLQKHRDFHPLEIKKRGFDVEPETLRKKLPKGSRGGAGVIWLTRVDGRHRALICRRISD